MKPKRKVNDEISAKVLAQLTANIESRTAEQIAGWLIQQATGNVFGFLERGSLIALAGQIRRGEWRVEK